MTAGEFFSKALKRLWNWVRNGGWKVLAIVLGVLLSVLTIRSCTRQAAKTEAAQVALKSANSENAVLAKANDAGDRAVTRQQAAKAVILATEAQRLESMQVALEANPEWADQPIPEAVLRELSQ